MEMKMTFIYMAVVMLMVLTIFSPTSKTASAVGYSKASTNCYKGVDNKDVLLSVDNQKAIIIVYGSPTCYNTRSLLKGISQSDWSGSNDLKVIFADIKRSSLDDVLEFSKELKNISCCYDTTGTTNKDAWFYVRQTGITSSFTMPLVVIADQNDQVQYISTGYTTAEAVYNGITAFTDIKIGNPQGVPAEVKINAPSTVNTSNPTVKVNGNGVNKTLTIKDGMLDVSSLGNGKYSFTFSANNCAPRKYSVTISNGTASGIDGSVELNLYGDINGDGKLTLGDVLKANAAARNSKQLTGYEANVADINNDGKITLSDVLKMNAHARNSKLLW